MKSYLDIVNGSKAWTEVSREALLSRVGKKEILFAYYKIKIVYHYIS